MRLSAREFEAVVQQALTDIPERLARYLQDVCVDIERMPSRDDLEAAGIEDPEELLGMYHGTPLTERGLEQDMHLPDRITIYQRNLERLCDNREELILEIRLTVFHEIGHHFGLDEDELAELGYE
jgi:predicted Zn-dependent protease with MMP-like domain